MIVFDRIVNKIRRFFYNRWGGKLGYGCRVTAQEWNKQYSSGEWDKLMTVDEEDHYVTIVSRCVSEIKKNKILDLGCGSGALFFYFLKSKSANYEYRGIDLSHEAISMAKESYSGVEFEVGDLDHYMPKSTFDRIIFNESLYYLRRPMKVLKRLESRLNAKGTFVISMCDYKGHDAIWRELDKSYICLSRDELVNKHDQLWRVSEYLVKR